MKLGQEEITILRRPNNKHTWRYEIQILFLQSPPPEGDKSSHYLEI